jgi:hypothetical protein
MNIQNKIIWNTIFTNPISISPSDKADFINLFTHLPHKGVGSVFVETGKVEATKEILKKIIGDDEWRYYPRGFISDSFYDKDFYYGKFDVEPEQLEKFFLTMINENIRIINCGFFYETFSG